MSVYQVEEYYISITDDNVLHCKNKLETYLDNSEYSGDYGISGNTVNVHHFYDEDEAIDFKNELLMIIGI